MMKIAAAATMVTAAMAAPHNNKFSGAPSLDSSAAPKSTRHPQLSALP